MYPLGEPAQVQILPAPIFFLPFFASLTCQGLVQEVLELHEQFDEDAGRAQSTGNPLGLIQLLVELVPQRLDGLPVVDVHLVLRKPTTYKSACMPISFLVWKVSTEHMEAISMLHRKETYKTPSSGCFSYFAC